MSLAVPTPIHPALLKSILEEYEYSVVAQDEFNWVLSKSPNDVPIILPKLGDLVSVEIMMEALFTAAGMDLRTYFSLKKKIESQRTVN